MPFFLQRQQPFLPLRSVIPRTRISRRIRFRISTGFPHGSRIRGRRRRIHQGRCRIPHRRRRISHTLTRCRISRTFAADAESECVHCHHFDAASREFRLRDAGFRRWRRQWHYGRRRWSLTRRHASANFGECDSRDCRYEFASLHRRSSALFSSGNAENRNATTVAETADAATW